MNDVIMPLPALLPPDLLSGPAAQLDARKGPADAAQRIDAAKKFEAVLLHRLLLEMDRTVEKSGLLDSSTSTQTQGMFWQFLAEDLADQGGIGLWKQIEQSMQRAEAPRSDSTVEVNL